MTQRNDEIPALRDIRSVNPPQTGRVVQGSDGDVLPYRLTLPNDADTNACEDFLRELHSTEQPLTVRSYAYDLLTWFRFLAAVDVAWSRATPTDFRDFVLWMRQATKSGGAKRATKRDPRVSRNATTGKRYLDDGYKLSTINHSETVIHEFYKHHERHHRVLLNPVLRGSAGETRSGAHQNPLDRRRRKSRGGSRQKDGKRLPRSMSDEAYDAFFEALGSNRDRALIETYVSSGARPSEVLGMDGEDLDMPNGLITIRRKGGVDTQVVPVSLDAVSWLRRYQQEHGVAAPGEPVWSTLRAPRRRVTYDALRAVFRRANKELGTNWTPHDLRHTAATRMLNDGTPVRVVQEVLGHASLDTMIVYTTPGLEEQIAAVRRTQGDAAATQTGPRLEYDEDAMKLLFGDD